MSRKPVARATALALALCGLALELAPAAAAAPSVVGPYFSAVFQANKLRYAFSQDPSWTRTGHVLSAQLDGAGITQIYRARLDGSQQVCLTCRTVRGPNGLPQERPEGDWILFESEGQQPVRVGGPGLGGFGSDLYAMRPDGSHPYRLTTNSDPNDGAPFSQTTGVPYDNFHAYWSPDGRHIIWTHTEANALSKGGGQTWSILLGDFTVKNGRPALRNVRVVGKPYGAYETQPWSPDGKGFLFCAAGGYKSPYQSAPPGWGNMRLYYMRLYGNGASPARPRVTMIGDNEPVYQEQAILTPDLKTVIMMSNRGSTHGSWYDLIAAAAQRTAFDAPETGSTQTLQFLADFDGPDFRSDLFAVDIRTRAIRRLTYINRVIPEFYWNHNYTTILWSLGGPSTPSYTARFLSIKAAQRKVPAQTPSWLYGKPVDMARVGAQAQPIRDPGPTDNTPIAVHPPSNPVPGFPHATKGSDKGTIPAVIATYLVQWLSDLKTLSALANMAFTTNPLKRLGVG